MARAKTEEYFGKGMVLDSLKKAHVHPYFKIAIISSIVFYPLHILYHPSSIKRSSIPLYVTLTQPGRVLSARFIRIKLSNRSSVPQVRLPVGKSGMI